MVQRLNCEVWPFVFESCGVFNGDFGEGAENVFLTEHYDFCNATSTKILDIYP